MTEHRFRRRSEAITIMAVGGVLLFLGGVWLGEENRPGRGIAWLFSHGGVVGLLSVLTVFVFSVVIVVHMVLLVSSWRRRSLVTAVASCALISLVTVGVVLGDRSQSQAIHSCFDQQESLRTALRTHRSIHGSYPPSLDALVGVPIPGERILRGSVLNYRLTTDGYILSVADPLMVSEATESHGFISSK